MTFPNGEIFEGQWVGGKPHGKVKASFQNGDVYEGGWWAGEECRIGKVTRKDCSVYEGETKDGKPHGKGTLRHEGGTSHEGQWVKGKRHGRGTLAYASGPIIEGRWEEGLIRNGKGTLKTIDCDYEGEWTDGAFSTNMEGEMTTFHVRSPRRLFEDASPSLSNQMQQPTKTKRVYSHERQLRSQRSQQQRLQGNVAPNRCEHCGVDDGLYKLRVCSGCNLALYCSASCQKAARRSHQRICDIVADLPQKDADGLVLKYDKEKANDFDAGLRYGTKYMANLKHLHINLEKMMMGDEPKLSAKHLSSLLKSKKGALESIFWLQEDYFSAGNEVWAELHGLKQLCLEYMTFDNVQPVCNIISQQKNTLMVLSLPKLRIDWSKAKTRRAVALAVGACKHLVNLDLEQCVLMDADLKVMLHDLPDLRILNLSRTTKHSYEFTDNTCGLIARKCPGLQELCLNCHHHLSVRGLCKIFEGCIHLRAFYTTTQKLNSMSIQTLLDVAPQLLHLSLLGDQRNISTRELDDIIESTGGRTAFSFCSGDRFYEPQRNVTSVKTRETYDRQKGVLSEIWGKHDDPEVANEWAAL